MPRIVNDFKIGATFILYGKLEDSNSVFDSSGYSIACQLNDVSGNKIDTLTAEFITPDYEGYNFLISKPASYTRLWPPGAAVYDIKITAPNGIVDYTVTENINLIVNVTP